LPVVDGIHPQSNKFATGVENKTTGDSKLNLMAALQHVHILFFNCDTTAQYVTETAMCRSRKYPYSPHRRDWNFLGGGGFCKTKKFKEMCEALLEFPEGWGSLRKNPFRWGGMDIFWNNTIPNRAGKAIKRCY